MENYTKGKNVEEEWSRDKIPIPNLPENFLWMQVSGGSKMRNLLEHALNGMEAEGSILWSGSGAGLQKAVSCAEVVKRKHQVHQITKICYRKVHEHWDPQLEGLEPLVVIRDIPTIHILLSKHPLDPNEPGYQGVLKKGENKPVNQSVGSAVGKSKPRRSKNQRRSDMLKQFTKKE